MDRLASCIMHLAAQLIAHSSRVSMCLTDGHLGMSVVFDIRSLFRDLTVEALWNSRRWDHPVRIACTRGFAGSGGGTLQEAQIWLSTKRIEQTNSS